MDWTARNGLEWAHDAIAAHGTPVEASGVRSARRARRFRRRPGRAHRGPTGRRRAAAPLSRVRGRQHGLRAESRAATGLDREDAVTGSLYARAGIQDYWVLNLVDRVLEVYRDPVPDAAAPYAWRYQTVTVAIPPAVVTPLA